MDWPGLLKKMAPNAMPTVVDAFRSADAVFESFSLTSPLVLAHFLAQASHETGAFTRLEENLNYNASRLMAVWPKRFPSLDIAKAHAGKPERIANKVYGGRLGNVAPDDGWRYRGQGLLHPTGRANYARLGRLSQLPLEQQPELVRAARYMLPIALHDWNSRKLTPLALADDLEGITRNINGGLNGLENRAEWLMDWKGALGV